MTQPSTIAETCIMQALRRAARLATATFEAHLRPHDLSASQFSVLVALRAAPGVSLGRLADQLGMDRTTLTRVLGPLRRRNLVAMVSDKEDRRSRIPALTDAGAELLVAASVAWTAAQTDTLARLGPDWAKAKSTLDRLA